MSGDNPRGLRELPVDAAGELAGVWIPAGFGEAPAEPPTPLGWELLVDDALLLGAALSRRGASLPRLSRRFARIGGYGYHAFSPLARAARSLVPLDSVGLALAVAAEARDDAHRLEPDRVRASRLGLGRLLVRVRRHLTTLEREILRHERDAAQHYRWLVEMDLGILPDDALGTTLEECVAIQRASRRLEIEATLDLLGTYALLLRYAERQSAVDRVELAGAALVPDALELAGATPALALSSIARAGELTPSADGDGAAGAVPRALAEFIEGFGERGPHESEPSQPRWREQPECLLRASELLRRSDVHRADLRLSRARAEREALLRRACARLGPVDRAIFRSLVAATKRLVVLRSRMHLVRARTLAMLRTAVLDVDRRLTRLIGSDPGSAFFLQMRELLSSTIRPKPELAALARERRAAWLAARAVLPPPAVIGRAAQARNPDEPLHGVGVGTGRTTGPAFVASNFAHALEMPPSAVLVTRSLDVGWTPIVFAASAVVTEVGGLTDEGAVVAAALGVPLVLGAVEATVRIRNGDVVHVDAAAGVVEREPAETRALGAVGWDGAVRGEPAGAGRFTAP